MNKTIQLLLLLILFSLSTFSQQTVGLFTNTTEAYNGYTLFAPIKSTETYLINNCGEKVHSWTSQYQPGLSCYLMENGVLLRTGKVPGIGGGSGIVEMIDWEGNVIWDYSISSELGNQHHDIELLPNGNILFIASDVRTKSEVTQAGSSTPFSEIKSEQIIEVQPDLNFGGGTVVWEWKAWDHLIQDTDPAKDNYGTISESPEKIDINFLSHNTPDWLHINGVDYNEDFDQIIVSNHNFSEFWIIDHSTTTTEASGSSGGTYGKGGDLLYRWGNPQAYDQGSVNDQKLFLQHHTHWIPNSFPDGGKIILFNNQAGTLEGEDYSTVNIVDLSVDSEGFYDYGGTSYDPVDFDWTYKASNPTSFYSHIISGVQRLENGNTLICEGVTGTFFEVNENKDIVWEYINPVNDNGPINQNTTAENNNVFRCTRYAPDYLGLKNKDLSSQGYIESGSTFTCDLYSVGISNTELDNIKYKIYPNPANNYIKLSTIDIPDVDLKVEIFNVNGQCLIKEFFKSDNAELRIDVSSLNNGIYFINVSNGSDNWLEKLIVY
ncbi:MAG: T9SS type A sorting domain-containing protein [Bacteroidetes bacterium]|nr:T9SS type A sorting domain-containing protein [Bacteroidota bacterium]